MAAPLVIFYCRFATVSSLKMHIENERSPLAPRVPPFNLGKMTMMLIGGIEHVLLLMLLAVLDKGRIIACFMKGLYSISRCWSENSYNSLSSLYTPPYSELLLLPCRAAHCVGHTQHATLLYTETHLFLEMRRMHGVQISSLMSHFIWNQRMKKCTCPYKVRWRSWNFWKPGKQFCLIHCLDFEKILSLKWLSGDLVK